MKETRKEQIVRQAELFSELSPEDILVIAENSVIRRYKKGDTVFQQGDPGRSLYIVETGQVIVRKTDEEGRSKVIARYVSGNLFGELDLFTSSVRGASALADEETWVLEFPRRGKDFFEFLEESPSASARMLHRILVETAGRVRRVNALVKENSPLVQELQKQVYRDTLTGLYNQVYLTEKLRELTEKSDSAKGNFAFALTITKPDNFKALNDAYGHDAGDLAIKILAGGLRDFIGEDEQIARYKGNAMAVVFPGLSRDEAREKARKIREFINKLDVTKAAGGNEFRVTASVGVCMYPDFGGTLEEMLFKTHELPLAGRSGGGNKILFTDERGEL
ncbi:MAG: GGDEF domain-containing protein [Spirochaetaceae bacterium]|nr:GGDEF domain-containing protein [Spirochaetaceae bacterium]MCF7948368.1 GGDEF domain-containing protein [Spirochaetia bacterium]MCF7950833.1 GGDEF domain-containing protein [Spirochaetaceae bacterium]